MYSSSCIHWQYLGRATDETIDRFKWYAESLGISRHTPDTYFNGLNQSVHSSESSYNNYKTAIDTELAIAPKIDIVASCNVNTTNFTVSINGSIGNISYEDLTDLIVGAMIYEDSVSEKVFDFELWFFGFNLNFLS